MLSVVMEHQLSQLLIYQSLSLSLIICLAKGSRKKSSYLVARPLFCGFPKAFREMVHFLLMATGYCCEYFMVHL